MRLIDRPAGGKVIQPRHRRLENRDTLAARVKGARDRRGHDRLPDLGPRPGYEHTGRAVGKRPNMASFRRHVR